MIVLNFAKDFHHVNSGKSTVNNKLTKFIVSFLVTFIIKYLLAQNKNNISSILIDTIKFVISNFLSKLIVGLIFLDVILPIIHGDRNFTHHVEDMMFSNNPVIHEIISTLSHVALMAVFFVINKLIDSIGDSNKSFNLDNMSNILLQQLLTLRSLH